MTMTERGSDVFNNLVNFLGAERIEFVGSRVTCDPAPLDTDLDVLILFENMDYMAKWVTYLFHVDRSVTTAHDYAMIESLSKFSSYRLGYLNFIVTVNKNFFESFMIATEYCKKHNVLDKKKRIEIFNKVMELRKVDDSL